MEGLNCLLWQDGGYNSRTMGGGSLGKGSRSSLEQEVESLRRRVAELEAAASEHLSDGQRLSHLNADLSRSLDDAPIGLCDLDTDLRYVHVNKWLARINGLPVEAHLGKTIGEVLPDVAAGVEPQLREVITTGQPVVAGAVRAETSAHPGVKRDYEHCRAARARDRGTPGTRRLCLPHRKAARHRDVGARAGGGDDRRRPGRGRRTGHQRDDAALRFPERHWCGRQPQSLTAGRGTVPGDPPGQAGECSMGAGPSQNHTNGP